VNSVVHWAIYWCILNAAVIRKCGNRIEECRFGELTVKLAKVAKKWAREIKRDVVAVYFAARDTRTPLWLRLLAATVAAYALSPIDLIPDFIPVLGYLDDLLIVPMGLLIVVRYLPPEILADARARATAVMDRPSSKYAAPVIMGIWLMCAMAAGYWFVKR
jgi:uncharacterized membrane protein YkvA (DUF1232 family)